MAYIVMAYMVYIVMAYIVMAAELQDHRLELPFLSLQLQTLGFKHSFESLDPSIQLSDPSTQLITVFTLCRR